VRISDGAIVAACTLSNRYISDRFLPDKAIDLMDEAASRLRMIVDSKPEEIDELDRRIIQLKIEREALKRESDKASQERLLKLETELADLEEKSLNLSTVWRAEKEILNQAQKLKEQLDSLRSELEMAQRRGDLARAGQILYGLIPDLEAKLQEIESKQTQRSLKEEVTDQDIAAIVERWTGIPVEKMLTGEQHKLLGMEDALRQRVIGQDEAIKSIANAIRRARAGLARSQSSHGFLPLSWPHGGWKNRINKGFGRILV